MNFIRFFLWISFFPSLLLSVSYDDLVEQVYIPLKNASAQYERTRSDADRDEFLQIFDSCQPLILAARNRLASIAEPEPFSSEDMMARTLQQIDQMVNKVQNSQAIAKQTALQARGATVAAQDKPTRTTPKSILKHKSITDRSHARHYAAPFDQQDVMSDLVAIEQGFNFDLQDMNHIFARLQARVVDLDILQNRLAVARNVAYEQCMEDFCVRVSDDPSYEQDLDPAVARQVREHRRKKPIVPRDIFEIQDRLKMLREKLHNLLNSLHSVQQEVDVLTGKKAPQLPETRVSFSFPADVVWLQNVEEA